MSAPFRIGIAGLGTVGVGVIKALQKNEALITARSGRPIEIACVSARSKNKDRGVDVSAYNWIDHAPDMANVEGLDAIVEMIGGAEGDAADLVNAALDKGISVVTANKALLAHHGYDLALKAEGKNASLAYEAAVAGGIPIIKAMREGFAANKFSAVYGILNGTCNYILTMMRETGRDFEDILTEAQEQGYAEADPAFDVDGIDAAHKLCLLTAIAFGTKPDFDALKITGIRHINTTDINYATEFGYRIKLLGIARDVNGQIMQILEPCLVPIGSPMGIIEDVYNAVYVEGDFVETPLLTGKGAGEGPTASSVMSDIIDLARGFKVPTFGIPVAKLKQAEWIDLGQTTARYYIRLSVLDQPGVVAEITAILKELGISIEGMVQRARDPGQPVPIVITTHETKQSAMDIAAKQIENLASCTEAPCVMRIEEL